MRPPTSMRVQKHSRLASTVLREHAFFYVCFFLALGVLYPFWVPLATGIVLAYVCEGPVETLLKRLEWHDQRRRWAVSIAFVSLVQVLFIAPLLILGMTAAQELVVFWGQMTHGSLSSTATAAGSELKIWLATFAGGFIERFNLPISVGDVTSRVLGVIEPLLKFLAAAFGRLLSSTPELVLFLFVSWSAWIYFLAVGRHHRLAIIPRLIPWRRQRELISSTLGSVLRQMVLASIALAIVQSVLVTISLGLAGIPKFYLWGALSFFTSFVPIVGTFPVMAASAVYLFLQDSIVPAALIVAASAGIGLSDNVLRPFLMRGATEIGLFWLFLSLLGGVAMFGFGGIILGPWFLTLFAAVQQDIASRVRQ